MLPSNGTDMPRYDEYKFHYEQHVSQPYCTDDLGGKKLRWLIVSPNGIVCILCKTYAERCGTISKRLRKSPYNTCSRPSALVVTDRYACHSSSKAHLTALDWGHTHHSLFKDNFVDENDEASLAPDSPGLTDAYLVADIKSMFSRWNRNTVNCDSIDEVAYRLSNHIRTAYRMLRRSASSTEYTDAIKNARLLGGLVLPFGGDEQCFYYRIRDILAKLIHRDLVRDIKDSKVLTLHLDEKDGDLEMKVRYEASNKSIIRHYAFVKMDGGKGEDVYNRTDREFKKDKIIIRKCITSFCADGASIMGTMWFVFHDWDADDYKVPDSISCSRYIVDDSRRVIVIHCATHRLILAFKDQLDFHLTARWIKGIMTNMYNHFKESHVNKIDVASIAAIRELKIKLKFMYEVKLTNWLSIDDQLRTFLDTLPEIELHFEALYVKYGAKRNALPQKLGRQHRECAATIR